MDTKTKYLCIIICPKKFKFAHNVFEVTELCRTRADISELKIRRRRDSTTADVVEGAWGEVAVAMARKIALRKLARRRVVVAPFPVEV